MLEKIFSDKVSKTLNVPIVKIPLLVLFGALLFYLGILIGRAFGEAINHIRGF